MSFTEAIIEPQNFEYQDTLVMYPYPIFGNIQNTGSRLQVMVDEVGVPVVASDLYLQNKKTIFDMAARQANQPEGETFVSMSQRRADYFADIADKLGIKTRVAMADSLGVSAAQGMQLHGDQGFDALLLRDGWNLDESTTTLRGIMRYARYQVRDVIHQRRDKVSLDIPKTEYEDAPAEKNETSIIAKLRNVADIMRGSHNRENAILIAGLSDVVMNVVMLENGLSSSNSKKLEGFDFSLRMARALRNEDKATDKLLVGTHPGWHSDLLDPKRGAKDLRQTLELLADN